MLIELMTEKDRERAKIAGFHQRFGGDELDEAIIHGAVKRARPKIMTVAAAFMGLLPIMWSTSAGADVMKRIAAPLIGGILTSFLLELVVYPPVYQIWKWNFEVKRQLPGPAAAP